MPPKGWKKKNQEPETFEPKQPTEILQGEAPLPSPVQNENADHIENDTEVHDFVPQKDLFRIDEVARICDISERCVRLWLDHGHLEAVKMVGTIRIKRSSIIRCIEKYIPKLQN